MSFPSDQKILGSIPYSPIFLYIDEIFHGIYGLIISILQGPLSVFCLGLSSEETLALCWPQVRLDPPIVSVYVDLRDFQKPWHSDKWYKGKLKKKKKPVIINLFIHKILSFKTKNFFYIIFCTC